MAGGQEITRRLALRKLGELAQCPIQDAVKLAFLEDESQIDQLDLGALAEFRRSDKGAVEIKLVDRAAIWRELAQLTDKRNAKGTREFFQAIKE